ncbi:MAG: DNA topoisomerase IV subunit B [Alphaproteobacteria bacterium]|nr:DNA topoisomerase IV subunit B [Alphaproteobacteria bacterium]
MFDDAADEPRREAPKKARGYTAKDIEVLEGLEPVRRRPGMYIGGTDERALHHLAAEVLDNAMDEAVSGHADRIEVSLADDGTLTVTDNGRGIPVDPHPKFKNKSALEVILTTLHSGGKFGDGVYQTSGGLHGVGVSVVNALSESLHVEVARDRQVWAQDYERGKPKSKLRKLKAAQNRRGTLVAFRPDRQVFGEQVRFQPRRLYEMARSKAYLYRGVQIRWACTSDLANSGDVPSQETLHFPGGILDYLRTTMGDRPLVGAAIFSGRADLNGTKGHVEWAICWPADSEGFVSSYCNTVPTPEGGSHVAGIRAALTKGLKGYGELTNNRRASRVTADDIFDGVAVMLSLFIGEPLFQGQTKERLSMPEAARVVEAQVKDHFDLYLSADPGTADALLDWAIERAEERRRRRENRELARKSATRKVRLPGKLADCSRSTAEGTELFIVEGDSAGGSAKQARNRETQAILPLRGKILNVASATADKLAANQELRDLTQALGCGSGKTFDLAKLRYERIVIMTDADVDGAHIASLLMTFFYREMPKLVTDGHLYLAVPPLYRLSRGGEVRYAIDDKERERLLADEFSGAGKVEISRFKGLGEMPPAQLKETTMNPEKRVLIQVKLPSATTEDKNEAKEAKATAQLVEQLMGRKPEKRFAYIQKNARFVDDVDV